MPQGPCSRLGHGAPILTGSCQAPCSFAGNKGVPSLTNIIELRHLVQMPKVARFHFLECITTPALHLSSLECTVSLSCSLHVLPLHQLSITQDFLGLLNL
uniref:Uncharacterized protein n=1 Tax=Arundo donax TaxID=35708 RepID=A0A0A9F6M7_ARUDO